MLKPFGELEQGSLLIHPASQCLFGELAVGDVVLNPHSVQKLSRGIGDARGRDGRPEVTAVLTKDTFLDRVTIDLAADLTPELPHVVVDILRQGLLENC